MTQAIRPQPGPQETFLASPADIVIYGGAAGGGKSYGLLLEPLRHVEVKGFGAVIFRREAVQITSEGGLWDTAMSIYPAVGGRPRSGSIRNFVWPSGAKVTFWHLHNDAAALDWQGSQIPLIGFDELTHFSRYQFFYMMSRNRSACGVRPYIRATTNPDADSWVAGFIEWWIDQQTGYPIPERSGVVRWFVRVNDVMQWGGSREELAERYGVSHDDCKSVTFIAASITDNQALLKADPGYLANLKALSRVERERLLGGNWKIRPSAGLYFNRAEVEMIDEPPVDIVQWVRSWDLAATEVGEGNDDPDWTAGVRMGRTTSGKYVISHLAHERMKSDRVRKMIRNIATQDGITVRITVPQDPGQAGKGQAIDYVTMLAGYPAFRRLQSGNKIARAEPFAAQWQAGNVQVVRGAWNEALFGELEGFPSSSSKAHDDIVDACSDAFAELLTVRPIPTSMKVDSL